jgi:hypothetical protein
MQLMSTRTLFLSSRKWKTPSPEDGLWRFLEEIQVGAELRTSETTSGFFTSVLDLTVGITSSGLPNVDLSRIKTSYFKYEPINKCIKLTNDEITNC